MATVVGRVVCAGGARQLVNGHQQRGTAGGASTYQGFLGQSSNRQIENGNLRQSLLCLCKN